MRQTATLAAALLLAACTHNVPVAFRPEFQRAVPYPEENQLAAVRPPVHVGRGEFQDQRANARAETLVTFKQGGSTYKVRVQRPIELAFYEGLNKIFTGSGQVWSESGDAELKANVQLLDVQTGRHFLEIRSSIQAQLTLVNARTGAAVYTASYTGRDARTEALAALVAQAVEASLNAAILEWLESVAMDAQLASALRRLHSAN